MEYEWAATHTGPLPMPDGTEVPPTGQQVTIPVVSVFSVADGKTTQHRMYFDQLSTMTLLGLLTPPSA